MKISMPNLQNMPKVSSFLKGSKISSTLSFFKGVIFALGLCVGVGAVLAAPPGNPPTCPNTNPACIAPINSGIANITQFINLGGLWVNSLGAQSLTVGTAPTTVGQPLVATNTTGGVGWGAVSAGGSSLITKVGSTSVTPCTNTNSCVKNISFSSPFPTGATPILVTAQPMWTRDNGGEHSTWRVDNPTYNGFTFTMTQPNNGTNNGVGTVMWSAYFDPTVYDAATLDNASCTATYVPNGNNPYVSWKLSAPNAYVEVRVVNSNNPGYVFASGLSSPVVNYELGKEYASLIDPPVHGTYTKSYIVTDVREVSKTVTCSVNLP